MSTKPSPILPLAFAALASIAAAVGITQLGSDRPAANTVQPQQAARPIWAASASGRVEPRGGEIKLSSPTVGRIVEVSASINGKVKAGDVLVRLEDEEPRTKVAAAESEVAVRRRERDQETVTGQALDRRRAEDAVFTAERAHIAARSEFDRLVRAEQRTPGELAVGSLEGARIVLDNAMAKLESERAALKRVSGQNGMPLPTRLEVGLTQARAELALAEAALDRTRLRAPVDGTILQLAARVGELAAATPEQIMLVMGDLSTLRVRAEVEERDVAKIKHGQLVVLRTDAFGGEEFGGRVATVASALGPARLAQRGPRRPNDLDTLEVTIDVDAGSKLMPGMRVDVLFRPMDAAGPTAAGPGGGAKQ